MIDGPKRIDPRAAIQPRLDALTPAEREHAELEMDSGVATSLMINSFAKRWGLPEGCTDINDIHEQWCEALYRPDIDRSYEAARIIRAGSLWLAEQRWPSTSEFVALVASTTTDPLPD